MSFRVKPLADQVKEAREAANLSQVELAHKLGVSPRTVQNWERGMTPQPKHRRKIAVFVDEQEAVA